MELVKTDSSMVYAVGYDEEAHALEVVFNNGSIYRYLDVPREVYQELLDAESKGRYMRESVIGFYVFKRLDRG